MLRDLEPLFELMLHHYKPRFRRWIELEELKDKIIRAVGENSSEFPKHLVDFLSTALPFSSLFNRLPWIYPMKAFVFLLKATSLDLDIPIAKGSGGNQRKDNWDYEGRTWHLYSHILADAYGWTLEYIANLPVLEALSKVQEILTEKQLDKEFDWMQSEVAYRYDKASKKSYLQKLNRPAWMRPHMETIQRKKMPRYLIPVGAVNYDAIKEELRPREIEKTSEAKNA